MSDETTEQNETPEEHAPEVTAQETAPEPVTEETPAPEAEAAAAEPEAEAVPAAEAQALAEEPSEPEVQLSSKERRRLDRSTHTEARPTRTPEERH